MKISLGGIDTVRLALVIFTLFVTATSTFITTHGRHGRLVTHHGLVIRDNSTVNAASVCPLSGPSSSGNQCFAPNVKALNVSTTSLQPNTTSCPTATVVITVTEWFAPWNTNTSMPFLDATQRPAENSEGVVSGTSSAASETKDPQAVSVQAITPSSGLTPISFSSTTFETSTISSSDLSSKVPVQSLISAQSLSPSFVNNTALQTTFITASVASKNVSFISSAPVQLDTSVSSAAFQKDLSSQTLVYNEMLNTTETSFIASSTKTAFPGPTVRYASSTSVPKVKSYKLHGSSTDSPSSKYIPHRDPMNQQLPKEVLVPGVNGKLTTDYSIAPDTGVLSMNSSTQTAPLKQTPHLSRDGGKGGYLNGQKLFIFCDTGSYTTTTATTKGNFLGFVGSSVAIDVGGNAKSGQALSIQDGIAQWSDDAGRLRGFSPLTQGEQTYNLIMQGQGYRYAIWPESSIIPCNYTTALLYSPIVYLDVNMETKNFKYTYTGNTLLAVTTQPLGGPKATRVVSRLFGQDEPEWGTIGAIRSYGSSGVGGNDGRIYVLASIKAGLLIGRVDVTRVADKSSYEYWNGKAWGSKMPGEDASAVFLPGSYMDGDMFYSPYHLTFIFVYLTAYADSTFYYRYLLTDKPILPSYVKGGYFGDFVETIIKQKWSEPQVLYKAPQGPTGRFVYAGGVQSSYFDDEDIANGGKRMMLSWTSPTGGDPASLASEYSFVTAEITWQ